MAIISKSKQLCFIHINRTGGSTIRQTLSRQIEDFKVIRNPNETVRDCIVLSPEVSNYYKFSFVRQPYDWILSMFHYIKMPTKNHPDYNIIKYLEFYEFLEWIQDMGMKRLESNDLPIYRTQSDYLFINDALMVDVFKYEGLCDDTHGSNLRNIFSKLNVPRPSSIPVVSKSERPFNYIDELSIKEIKLINKLFSEDFKNFKYFKYE